MTWAAEQAAENCDRFRRHVGHGSHNQCPGYFSRAGMQMYSRTEPNGDVLLCNVPLEGMRPLPAQQLAGQPAAAEPQYPAPHPDEPVAGARAVQAALTSALVDATGLPSADAWRYVDQARRELHPDGARVTMRGCYDMLRRAVSLADDGSLS